LIGFRKSTIFVFQCSGSGWITNTDNAGLKYRFYYIEVNTGNLKVEIQSISANQIVTKKFDTTYFQLDSSSIDVYCEVTNSIGAVSSKSVTV